MRYKLSHFIEDVCTVLAIAGFAYCLLGCQPQTYKFTRQPAPKRMPRVCKNCRDFSEYLKQPSK